MVTLERFEKGYLELFHAPRLIENYTAKVITDACFLILEEIPCEEYRVNIDGYNEVLNLGDIQEENDYFVDYTSCVVYFHKSKMGQSITITDYWGMGLNFLGTNRIITRISADGRIIETLDDVISAYPDLLNKLQEAREKIVIMQGLLDRIVPTQNPDFTVGKTNWVEFTQNGKTFYKYTLTHNLHSRNLIVSMMNLDTNMNMPSPAFSYNDENKITVYSVERVNAKYVICSKYYYGAENLNSEIIQEVRDSRFGKGSLTQKIAEMCAFMDNVNTTLTKKVNGIQIGTRNYLLNTGLKDNASSFSGLNSEVTRVTTKKTPSGNNCFYTKVSNKTSNVWRGATQEVTSGFSIGDTMTFSVWTYVTNEVATDEGLFVEVVGVASDNSTRTFVINKQVNANDVNKWIKYDLTFVVPKNTVKIKCLSYVVKNGSWYTGDYKLEKGNKATDWSPNPKDIDNAIDVNKSNIAINTSNITTNKNNITSLQNKTSHIKHISSVSELESTLNNALSGDVIYIKSGVYNVDRSYIIPDGVHIIGSGTNTCIFKCNNTSVNNVFRNKLNGGETGYHNVDIIIEGIFFNGLNTTHNITALCFGHASNVTIRHCEFKGFNSWHNIELNGCKDCYIYENRFSEYGTTSGGNPTEVIQLDYMGTRDQFPWTGNLDNTSCNGIIIRDNSFHKIKTNSTGAIGNHSTNQRIKNVEICGNTLDDVDCFYCLGGSADINIHHNSGINVGSFVKLVTGSSGKMLNINVNFNNIGGRMSWVNKETRDERFIDGSSEEDAVDGIIVSNNIISNFRGHAIAFTGHSTVISGNKIAGVNRSGVYLHGVTDFTVTGNVVLDWDKINQGYSAIQWGGNSSKPTGYGAIVGNKGKIAVKDNIVAGTIAETGNCTE